MNAKTPQQADQQRSDSAKNSWRLWEPYLAEGAWSTVRRGAGDLDFLQLILDKLLLDYAGWLKRKDSRHKNLFEGGFLGLDDIRADKGLNPTFRLLYYGDALLQSRIVFKLPVWSEVFFNVRIIPKIYKVKEARIAVYLNWKQSGKKLEPANDFSRYFK